MKNVVMLCGTISTEPTYSHTVNGQSFERFVLDVQRQSGIVDSIPIICRREHRPPLLTGEHLHITGQYRSWNDGDSHRNVFVLARKMRILDSSMSLNSVEIECAVCSTPTYRMLPSGKRLISTIVANNQPHGKSYYLPIIAWNRIADESKHIGIGDLVECLGRIQSRTYPKNGNILAVNELNCYSISPIMVNK